MTLDLMTEFVLASASVTDGKVIGVIILKGFFGHDGECSYGK
jgi:hypothetical protein